MEIIEFYNKGAQIQIQHPGVDMTHSFTASGSGEVEQIGYEPKGNAKPVEGPAHDIIEHDGKTLLALKGGHTYSVTLVGEEDKPDAPPLVHTISAEEGHVLLPLPANMLADVSEYDPNAQPEAPEQPAEEQAADEGMLGDESGDEAAGTE
jgi:hypothetical protein